MVFCLSRILKKKKNWCIDLKKSFQNMSLEEEGVFIIDTGKNMIKRKWYEEYKNTEATTECSIKKGLPKNFIGKHLYRVSFLRKLQSTSGDCFYSGKEDLPEKKPSLPRGPFLATHW